MDGNAAQGIVHGLIYVVILFGSVLLHEYGHALAARQCGVGTRKITLGMLGGVAHLQGRPLTNKQDLWVTIAGPLVNLVLWLLSHGAAELYVDNIDADDAGTHTRYLMWLLTFGSTNLWLMLFNLLPGWPMDGGRLLNCLLQFFLPPLRAMVITTYVAQVTAVGLVAWAVADYLEDGSFVIFRILIAVMVWQTAASYRRAIKPAS